jgi:hypothetical protein
MEKSKIVGRKIWSKGKATWIEDNEKKFHETKERKEYIYVYPTFYQYDIVAGRKEKKIFNVSGSHYYIETKVIDRTKK